MTYVVYWLYFEKIPCLTLIEHWIFSLLIKWELRSDFQLELQVGGRNGGRPSLNGNIVNPEE